MLYGCGYQEHMTLASIYILSPVWYIRMRARARPGINQDSVLSISISNTGYNSTVALKTLIMNSSAGTTASDQLEDISWHSRSSSRNNRISRSAPS